MLSFTHAKACVNHSLNGAKKLLLLFFALQCKGMKFEKIFARLPEANEINFRKYDISYCLKKNPKYLEFVNEKIALRHEIEKKYKKILTPEFLEKAKSPYSSYRPYIEGIAYKLGRGDQLHPLFEEDALIQKVVKGFIESHRSFQKEMEDYLGSKDSLIGKGIREKGLFPYLKKIEIEPEFFQLKNSTVCYSVSFFLNEKSKKIISEVYGDPDSTHFDEIAILKNNECLFWNDEYGYSFSDGYEDEEEKEKDRLEDEAVLKANGWILEDDGK